MTLRAWQLSTPPLGVPFVINRASPQAAGLVGWWPTLPGRTGGPLLPDMAGPNPATITTPVWQPDALAGQAISVNASTGYASASVVGHPKAGEARTLCGWVYQRTRNNGANSALFNQRAPSNQSFCILMAQIGGLVYLFTDNVSQNITISGSEIPSLNAWHHIAATFDGIVTFKYYLDGALTKTVAFGAGAVNTDANMTYEIGRRPTLEVTDSLIADPRIYNRALSAAEVFALYAPQTRWQLYGVPMARRGQSGGVLGEVFHSPIFGGSVLKAA